MSIFKRRVPAQKSLRRAHSLRRVIGRFSRGQIEPLESRALLAADLVISEFLANNGSTLADEDGDYSDWIEVHNRGTTDAQLSQWHLTDDANDLQKWTFPNQTLAAGNFLVVRASGKDRAVAGSPLHTNFSLDDRGEYLALTHDTPLPGEPDHVQIASEFTPSFPEQLKDVSFGFGQNVNISTVLSSNSAGRVFFPTNGSLGTSWTQPDFVDTAWTPAPPAIGYESSVPGFTVLDAKSSSTLSNLAQADAVLNGTRQVSAKTVISPTVNFWDTGGTGNYGNPSAFPNGTGGDDDDFAIRATGTILIPTAGVWTFGTNSDDGVRVRIDGSNVIHDDTLHGPDNRFGQATLSAGPHELELVFFERGGGAEVELFAAKGSYSTFNAAAFRLIGDVGAGGLTVQTVPGGAGGVAGSFSQYFQEEVGSSMNGVTSSAYLRTPFFVASPAGLGSLTLRVQYDDGFIAYLNGVELARRNAPANAGFDSVASTDRSVTDASQFENIDISSHLDLLRTGINVLAIHALNEAADSDEFLMVAELAEIAVTDNSEVYFTTPTPGTFNSATGIDGFLLNEITFDQPHGFYDAPITVSISAATAGTTVRYTTDGTEPTATNGTLYTGPLTINKTTTLRARAFKSGLSPSYVETTTYLFVSDILQQSANGAPPAGWPTSTNINGQTLNYGMDPTIVNNATWSSQLTAALKQVPTMSVVMNINDLLGSSNGIYTHAQNHGEAWERPVSLELIQPDGTAGFQINGGIRIRGGYSRTGDNPKHAFRFFFRDEYGESKLDFPLFGSEGVDKFDSFDLRTTQNYSWSFGGDGNNAFVRDVFSRDVQREMGQPYTRSRYYHLYINGQYWGLYQTQERSEASYAASYFGGKAEDYDVIKSAGSTGGYQNEATDGNMDAYQRLANFFYQAGGLSDSKMADYWKVQGMNSDGTTNPDFERLLDVDNLIDYMIITYYTGDRDGPATRFVTGRVNNYFAIINRENPDGFKFFEHDSEHSLDRGDNNMVSPLSQGGNSIAYFNPHWMHEQLATNNSEYRQRFADRVYKHLFNDGILTAANATALVDARAAEFDLAIIAESARWGDSKREPPFTKNDWQNAVNNVRNFIRTRSATVVQQLTTQGWYPATGAPQFTVNGNVSRGGVIDDNDAVRMFTESTTVYESLVAAGSQWKYLADGSNLGNQWRAADYNDNTWPAGQAELGYGDGGEATVIPCGQDCANGNKFVTSYFRKEFTVTSPSQYQVLRLGLRRDDGAAVYLNGVEIARSNLDANATYDQFANVAVGGADEATFFEFEVPTSRLVSGRNVLAVEVHQASMTSSDVSFDLRLEGAKLGANNFGTLYYTTDGSDPRAIGGQPSNVATLFDGNPLALGGSRIVNARAILNGNWSPLAVASFLLDEPASAANLRISEINYNPHAPLTQFGEANVDNDAFEFVELLNIGNATIDLTDVELQQVTVDGRDEGIAFRFATQTLGPGERIVVVSSRAAFQSRYGSGVRIADAAGTPWGTGVYTGSLSNSGERLTLADAQGNLIQQFDYNDTGAWPGRADGGASSLEVDDPSGDYNAPSNWRNSNEFGGSPGAAGTGAVHSVVINELLTHTDLPQIDTIEIYNATNQPIDIARWYISDSSDNYLRYQLAATAPPLAAGGYLVRTELDLGFGFRGEAADDAWLISADVTGKPWRFVDHVEFGASQNGVSLGRWANGNGKLFPMTTLTLGSANSGPALADVVLSEVEFNPTSSGTLLPNEGEFVELWNRGTATLDVSHWRLNNAVDFDFAENSQLTPDARVVVVPFDPVADPSKATAFRQHYGIATTVKLVGPFKGRLDDAGDTVELERPEDIAQLGLGYVLVDRVAYETASPWPDLPGDQSLHRITPVAYGDFAASWQASAASPGTGGTAPTLGDFNLDGQVNVTDIDLLCAQLLSPSPALSFDVNQSGQTDFADMHYLVEQILNTSFGDANLDGVFNSSDLVTVFQPGQYEDTIAGNSTWGTGDWNCDGDFTSGDLVLAFQGGTYSEAALQPATLPASQVDAAFVDFILYSPKTRRKPAAIV